MPRTFTHILLQVLTEVVLSSHILKDKQTLLNVMKIFHLEMHYHYYRLQGEGNVFTGVCLSTIGLVATHSLLDLVTVRLVRILLDCFLVLISFGPKHIRLDHLLELVAARKQSLRRLCFYTCLSVILFTGGRYPSRSPGPHPRGELRGLAWGVSRPTPGGSPGQTPQAGGYCCGRYASYWNAFLYY